MPGGMVGGSEAACREEWLEAVGRRAGRNGRRQWGGDREEGVGGSMPGAVACSRSESVNMTEKGIGHGKEYDDFI